jgi:hypothetical protein
MAAPANDPHGRYRPFVRRAVTVPTMDADTIRDTFLQFF